MWPYLHALETIETVRKLVAFYVVQHNEVMPRVMLGGRTPDEVYLGLNPNISMQLTNERQKARVDRINHNRAQRCGQCSGPADAQNVMSFDEGWLCNDELARVLVTGDPCSVERLYVAGTWLKRPERCDQTHAVGAFGARHGNQEFHRRMRRQGAALHLILYLAGYGAYEREAATAPALALFEAAGEFLV